MPCSIIAVSLPQRSTVEHEKSSVAIALLLPQRSTARNLALRLLGVKSSQGVCRQPTSCKPHNHIVQSNSRPACRQPSPCKSQSHIVRCNSRHDRIRCWNDGCRHRNAISIQGQVSNLIEGISIHYVRSCAMLIPGHSCAMCADRQ